MRVFFPFGEADDALVCRKTRGVVRAEVEADAAEQALVLTHMIGAHPLEATRGGFVQVRGGESFGVAGHVLVALVARGRGDEDSRRVGVVDSNAVLVRRRLSAFGEDEDAGLKFERALDAEGVAASPAQDERVAGLGRDRRLLRRLHRGVEADLAGAVCGQPNRDHLIQGA